MFIEYQKYLDMAYCSNIESVYLTHWKQQTVYCSESISFTQRYYRGRRAVHVPLSHIIILYGKPLCVSRCHGAHSQVLWVVSCQVMKMSLAQTRCECVLNAKQPVSLSSHQTERGYETVVGKHSRTDKASQSRPPDVLKILGKAPFRSG